MILYVYQPEPAAHRVGDHQLVLSDTAKTKVVAVVWVVPVRLILKELHLATGQPE